MRLLLGIVKEYTMFVGEAQANPNFSCQSHTNLWQSTWEYDLLNVYNCMTVYECTGLADINGFLHPFLLLQMIHQ